MVAAAAAAVFFLRPTEVAPVPGGVVVQSASAEGQPEVQPVVMKTETGDAIIWLVEHPDASGAHVPPTMQADKPSVRDAVAESGAAREGRAVTLPAVLLR